MVEEKIKRIVETKVREGGKSFPKTKIAAHLESGSSHNTNLSIFSIELNDVCGCKKKHVVKYELEKEG